MNFGEIVEPSTRALLGDDEDFNETKDIVWAEKVDVPKDINIILIVETNAAIDLIKVCLLEGLTPIATTESSEISIYKVENDCFVLCNNNNRSIGGITEKLLPWIEESKTVYTLTTSPAVLYQNILKEEIPSSFIKCLSTYPTEFKKLTSPNLVTGVGANILSYCIHMNRECALFAGYIDHSPLDSIISEPFLQLLKKINLKPTNKYILKSKLPTNNLYM